MRGLKNRSGTEDLTRRLSIYPEFEMLEALRAC